jgi:isoquinoline 1-oxidoreductase beta subunit
MLYAVVARCPVIGGSIASYDSSKAEAVPGVRHIVEIKSGIAVVADSTWAAIRGRTALEITWDKGENAELSTEGIRQTLFDEIDATEATPGAANTIEAVYDAPYLAHATMEPMVCVANVTADRCEVWAPTQDRGSALSRAVTTSGVRRDSVSLHVPLIGCGCGRRLEVDYVHEDVEISKAVGAPVKVQWTREDDIQHDYFRPMSVHWLRAEFDAQNQPLSWTHIISYRRGWSAQSRSADPV